MSARSPGQRACRGVEQTGLCDELGRPDGGQRGRGAGVVLEPPPAQRQEVDDDDLVHDVVDQDVVAGQVVVHEVVLLEVEEGGEDPAGDALGGVVLQRRVACQDLVERAHLVRPVDDVDVLLRHADRARALEVGVGELAQDGDVVEQLVGGKELRPRELLVDVAVSQERRCADDGEAAVGERAHVEEKGEVDGLAAGDEVDGEGVEEDAAVLGEGVEEEEAVGEDTWQSGGGGDK